MIWIFPDKLIRNKDNWEEKREGAYHVCNFILFSIEIEIPL
jgi:hypothetical protein